MNEGDPPTPKDPRPGTVRMREPLCIELEFADPDMVADFLERIAFVLRTRRGVKITIE